MTRWRLLLPSISPRPRSPTPKIHFCRLWRTGRGRGYAGGRRAPRFGNPGHPCFHLRKAGTDGICGTQRQAASSHQGRPQPCLRPAGCADFSPSSPPEWENTLTAIAKGEADPDGFMAGIEEMTRGLISGYSQISEDAQKIVSERAHGDWQVSPLRRSRLRGQEELLLRKPGLPVCHVEE